MDMSAAEFKRAALAQPQSSPSQSPTAELNGSEILVRCLQAEGVRHLWGYPGGAVLYIYDALYKQESIQHVLVRHEQAAVHAADGFARASGEVGVALVTSGPGATNTVTPVSKARVGCSAHSTFIQRSLSRSYSRLPTPHSAVCTTRPSPRPR